VRPESLLLIAFAPDPVWLLDSLEPFWISQIVAKMYSVNCKYSDCQFSITSAQNTADVT
jgi:hypothetical protein